MTKFLTSEIKVNFWIAQKHQVYKNNFGTWIYNNLY